MTALTGAPAPGHEGRMRPVPWREMTWVTWRQHRSTLAGLVAVLGAAGVYLYLTGLHLRQEVVAVNEMFAANGGKIDMTSAAFLFQAIPPLIGAFVGAPVLARELETGTFRYTWTQGFGRARWTAVKLAQLAAVVTVLAGAFGFLFSWCYGSIIGVPQGLSPLMSITFDLRGIAFAAWALVAFAIGALAGILIRRVVPAMAATLAAWSALAAATGVFLRRHYETPLVTGNPSLASTAWVISQRWTLHGKPASLSTVNQVLQKIGETEFAPGQFSSLPGSATPGSTPVNPAQYLLHHGFTQLTTYQPASRFWPFQFIESGWLLALSVLLIAATVWLVRRRAA